MTDRQIHQCGSESIRGSSQPARVVERRRPPRRRSRRRYGCGLFNKTPIRPDIVMYCIAPRDLSTTERLPVGLYGDRIYFSKSRDPFPSTGATRFFLQRRRSRRGTCRTRGVALIQYRLNVNPFNSKGNYSVTSNNTKLVHWPKYRPKYIWYSEEGPGRAATPPSPFAVPNVTAHPSTASASVPITALMMVRCSAVLMWGLNG